MTENTHAQDRIMQHPAAKPANHPPVKNGKVGVLLVNLGTPDGTDYTSMRRYLKEFLMDRRVIGGQDGRIVVHASLCFKSQGGHRLM